MNKEDDKESSKIFAVPDFVGDACKAIASRIRGAVAGVQFDDFHKVTYSDLLLDMDMIFLSSIPFFLSPPPPPPPPPLVLF